MMAALAGAVGVTLLFSGAQTLLSPLSGGACRRVRLRAGLFTVDHVRNICRGTGA